MSSVHSLQSNKSIYFTQMCFSDQPCSCDKPSKIISTDRETNLLALQKILFQEYLFTQHKIVYVYMPFFLSETNICIN